MSIHLLLLTLSLADGDGPSLSTLQKWETPHQINSVALSADASRLITAGAHGVVSLWSVSDAKLIGYLKGSRADSTCVAISPDGSMAAVGGIEGEVELYDLEKKTVIRAHGEHGSRLQHVAFSPDGSLLASSCWDGKIRWWSTRDGQRKAVKDATAIGMGSIGFLANAGQLLVPAQYESYPGNPSTSMSAPLARLSLTDGSPAKPLVGSASFWAIAPGVDRVAAGTESGEVVTWRMDQPEAPEHRWSILPSDHGPIGRGIVRVAILDKGETIFAISMSGFGGLFDRVGKKKVSIDRPTDAFVTADVQAGRLALCRWGNAIEIIDLSLKP
ncbi:hypothetical protein K2X85_08115 [bacterium]|nr:hypothetical protein [bacterium]